jgi:AraC-like DNA-binding protein
VPSAGGALARLVFARAQAERLELDPLLKSAGLSRRQLSNRKTWIPVRDQIKFVNLVADALEDDCLGFHLAQDFDLREVGLFYYTMASSGSLLEALQRAARYTAIVNEGIALSCKNGAQLSVTCSYVGVSRHVDRHQIEFWLTSIVRAVRQLSGLRLMPVRVRIAHRRNSCPAAFAEYFGGNISFGTSADEIVFEGRVAELPIVSADPHLNGFLLEYCEQALAHRRKGRGSFRANVENAIAPLLPHGKARADIVARELGLSSRTLARRLEDEGLTFSSLLQKLREDLGRRYLADDHLSVSQVAWLLGYREIGAFSHAFKRMTGKTPREARVENLTRRSVPSPRL